MATAGRLDRAAHKHVQTSKKVTEANNGSNLVNAERNDTCQATGPGVGARRAREGARGESLEAPGGSGS